MVRWLSGRIWDLHAKRSLNESMNTLFLDLPQVEHQSEQMTVRRNLGSSAPRGLVISLAEATLAPQWWCLKVVPLFVGAVCGSMVDLESMVPVTTFLRMVEILNVAPLSTLAIWVSLILAVAPLSALALMEDVRGWASLGILGILIVVLVPRLKILGWRPTFPIHGRLLQWTNKFVRRAFSWGPSIQISPHPIGTRWSTRRSPRRSRGASKRSPRRIIHGVAACASLDAPGSANLAAKALTKKALCINEKQ